MTTMNTRIILMFLKNMVLARVRLETLKDTELSLSLSDLSTSKCSFSPRSVSRSIFSVRICLVSSTFDLTSFILLNERFSLYRFVSMAKVDENSALNANGKAV